MFSDLDNIIKARGQSSRNELESLINSTIRRDQAGLIHHFCKPCQDTSAIEGLQRQRNVTTLLVDLSSGEDQSQKCTPNDSRGYSLSILQCFLDSVSS